MNNLSSITLFSSDMNANDGYVIFELAQNRYGISVKNVVEIVNFKKIEVSDKESLGIIGLINYNGNFIKLIDICPFLSVETPEFSLQDKLIIIKNENEMFAILTQNVLNVAKIDFNKIQRIDENSMFSGLYQNDEQTIKIFNVDNLAEKIIKNPSYIPSKNYNALIPADEKSKEVLDLREAQNKTALTAFNFAIDTNFSNQHILFTLGEHNYFLELKYVKEFISLNRYKITKLPYTKDYIKGLININGDFLMVLDLKRFLNNELTEINEHSKLIIANGQNFSIALLVDDVKYIKNLKPYNQYGKKSVCESEFILAEFSEEENLYNILDFEKILSDERLYVNIEYGK